MKTRNKNSRRKLKRIVLGVGHPWFEKVDGPGVVGYQKVSLMEGDGKGDALTLKIGELGGYSKIRLVAEVMRPDPWCVPSAWMSKGALEEQRALSSKTIDRIEAGMKKFFGKKIGLKKLLIRKEKRDMKTTRMATLDEIKAWAKKVAQRNLARESYTLKPSYIVEMVKKAAIWTDGEHFKLPFAWKASIGWKVTS